MLSELSTLRDTSRAYEIASALVRFGAHDLVRRIGLEDALHRLGRMLPGRSESPAHSDPAPVRFRKLLEELGPTFIKLGQVLATRVDLLAPDWIHELSQLQNHAPAVTWDAIEQQLTEDLGASPTSVFAQIDAAPLAAASIAQVHRATLIDGTPVVVKVRRPGIRPVIEADLRLLQRAAVAAGAHLPEFRQFHPAGIVRQFRASLLRELDLAAEGRHSERIARNAAGDSSLVIPRIHWDYTSERVNVQDFVAGVAVADRAALQASGMDPVLVAKRGAQAVLRMILRDGFYHADPHPGNVFVLEGNRIALIDFGMIGRLTAQRRREVVALLYGLVTHDAQRVGDVLLEWADTLGTSDEETLTQDIEEFVDRYHGVPLGQLDLAAMLLDVTRMLRANALALPSDLALVIKVCLTLEGLGRQLDPAFDMASEAAPFLRRAMRERYSPRQLAHDGARSIAEAVDTLSSLPHDLRKLLRRVRNGDAAFRVESKSLRTLSEQLTHAANRLTMGVVLAALVVGSSITMTVHGGPELFGLNVFGLMGFIGAVVAGTGLIISIWRSGK